MDNGNNHDNGNGGQRYVSKSDLEKQVKDLEKKKKMFMYVSVGLAVALVGALAYAFTK